MSVTSTKIPDNSSIPADIKNLSGYPGGTINFLRADASFATPAGGGGGVIDYKFVQKPTVTSRASNVTPSDDPHLIFPVGINQTWIIEYFLIIDGPSGADFQFTLNVPAGATGWLSGFRIVITATTAADAMGVSATTTFNAANARQCGTIT